MQQLHLIFEVPAGTTEEGFRRLLGPDDGEPAVVPLDTRVQVTTCSGTLAARKTARAQGVTYRVTSAALAPDYDGRRAPGGQCYLVVGLRMTFSAGALQPGRAAASSVLSATQGLMGAISATQGLVEAMAGRPQARLLVEDASVAPSGSKAISTPATGPFDLEEAFVVPESTARATLQVGDPAQPGAAEIPLASGGQ